MRFRISGSMFQLSLRTRFALGLGAVLLPFLVAAAVGQFYLLPRLIGPFNNIVRGMIEDMEPLMDLQKDVLVAAMPAHHYLIHGDPDERRQFAQVRRQVELTFAEAAPERYMQAEVRALIGAARKEWEQALRLGEELLRLPDPVGNAAAARDIERFDAHIDRAVSLLEQADVFFDRAIDENRVAAHAALTKGAWIIFGLFMLALTVASYTGAALGRSVIDPVNTLRQGAARLAEGKLSHRVTIHRHDELGELAAAFNAMAGQLETDQAALDQLATRDGLTGLYNHRAFYALLRDELARAKRFQRPVSLLLLDIDHFKRVNDTHGHLAGDAVLRGLGELLGREVRATDRVCRYGGEESTVILPETDLAAAARFAERLRAAVEAQPFDVDAGVPLRMTVSIGVASWPAHADNAQALVAAADAAMYAAKEGGRNRVVRYEPAPQG